MAILPYDPAMSRELASVYNQAVRPVPHCHPADAAELASALAPAVGEVEGHRRLHSEAVFAARQGCSMAGFIHVAIERPKEQDQPEQGVIRFACYARGQRRLGQSLLTAAEDYLRERGVARVTAFPQDYRYRFYHLEHAYLSDHMDLVQPLLTFNGYQRTRSEVFLDLPNFEPVVPVPSDVGADVSLEWREGRGVRPGLLLHARRDGRQVGVCVCVSCGEYATAAEAQQWVFTTWLGVEEEVQGRGLGRHLLQRALRETHAIGYRHAAISAAGDNARAFLFYSNFGYRVVDWTYAFSRDLK
jgi:predicted N-acetyltransferase YhbS